MFLAHDPNIDADPVLPAQDTRQADHARRKFRIARNATIDEQSQPGEPVSDPLASFHDFVDMIGFPKI